MELNFILSNYIFKFYRAVIDGLFVEKRHEMKEQLHLQQIYCRGSQHFVSSQEMC